MDSYEDPSYWDFLDCSLLDCTSTPDFFWPNQSTGADIDFSSGAAVSQAGSQAGSQAVSQAGSQAVSQEKEPLENQSSWKRRRSGSCNPGSKACREKLRREKLNDRFVDLSAILEPGRPAKTDKQAILDDAIRVVNQLRSEAQELKETNERLSEEIKTLKTEKNELREEKLALKADKEKIEQRLKGNTGAGFMPAAYHGNKMAVFPSYGYVPMWQYMPSAVRDTSHDHELRPPAA